MDEAVAAVERGRPKKGAKGHYGLDLKPESFYRLILDDTYAKFGLLEAAAHYHKVPVSMLLFFTRIKAELEEVSDEGQSRAKRIIDACQEFMSVVESLVGSRLDGQNKNTDESVALNYEDFTRAVAGYAEAFGGEKLNF